MIAYSLLDVVMIAKVFRDASTSLDVSSSIAFTCRASRRKINFRQGLVRHELSFLSRGGVVRFHTKWRASPLMLVIGAPSWVPFLNVLEMPLPSVLHSLVFHFRVSILMFN